MQGTVLRSRSLDLPQKEIEQRTAGLLRKAGLSEPQYRSLLKDLQLTYEKPVPFSATGGQQRPAERQRANGPPALDQVDYEQALRILRQTMDTLDNTKPKK